MYSDSLDAYIHNIKEQLEQKSSSGQNARSVAFVVTPITFHEIPNAIALAEQLDIDILNFVFADEIWPFLELYNNEFLVRVRGAVYKALNKTKVVISGLSELNQAGYNFIEAEYDWSIYSHW